MRAKVTTGGRLSLPVDLRKKYGLVRGGEVMIEDAGDAIVLRTLDQVVTQAREISRRLVAGHSGASVDDFLIERARESDAG
ncbi:MAG: AbrB/MazE/SpoVT family DNA-binding domain-containing protein [Candidatus Eremiobacteraeota bacterium]|nr:AbrB/MazE/SpoVT family DNA-binding domain-containing protein [Candidatus Eremiobacteraeota bacterium]MBC5802290.1 AbrB/MazE/SpoVT family DNA-binding domain-containing protein [Candidatus Eremiobacteraeota bacterium]MBC5820869.1 AbrB/MazE/SpoVT family DNA-binding domain-containing protein [Candidatus Eremiobacteraeota bacterium]